QHSAVCLTALSGTVCLFFCFFSLLPVWRAFDKWLLYNIRVHKGVIPEQLVLLLELLLDEPDLSLTALRALEKTYHLQDRDAEVRHRWCELVVKHKHTAAYKDVERFLLQDQAMGVYLYGELMVQEDAHQQALARRCFSQAQEEMDPAVRKVVEEMIY
uniref:Aminopeptidase O (putative) n=1 Tax=Paramormyrops kingsleyae TaxID=1676925 RepID=A0A3B3T7N5_9TELE